MYLPEQSQQRTTSTCDISSRNASKALFIFPGLPRNLRLLDPQMGQFSLRSVIIKETNVLIVGFGRIFALPGRVLETRQETRNPELLVEEICSYTSALEVEQPRPTPPAREPSRKSRLDEEKPPQASAAAQEET